MNRHYRALLTVCCNATVWLVRKGEEKRMAIVGCNLYVLLRRPATTRRPILFISTIAPFQSFFFFFLFNKSFQSFCVHSYHIINLCLSWENLFIGVCSISQIPLLSYGWDRMGNGHVCSFCFFKQPYCLAWLYNMYLNPPLCNDVPGMSMSIFLHLSASEFPNYHIHFSPLCCCLPTRMTTTAPRFSHCLPSTYTQSGAAVKVE